MASTAVTLTPEGEEKADRDQLLTVFVNVCGAPYALVKRHPMSLALQYNGIIHFLGAFIHMTAANIDSLQCIQSRALVPLEMNFKMILRALLAFYHHQSHKKRRGISILESTSGQFKNSRNTKHNPTQEIIPCGLALSKNKSLSNWNKVVKPSACDFKPCREVNNWVDYKDGFMITLEAQNLTHLVYNSYTVVDPDLNKAQQKYLYNAMKDTLLHCEAKSIVKFHTKTKDTRVVWEKMCNTYDNLSPLR